MTSSTAPRPTGDRDGANSQTDALAQMRVIVTLLNPLPEGRRQAILRHVLTYLEDHPDASAVEQVRAALRRAPVPDE